MLLVLTNRVWIIKPWIVRCAFLYAGSPKNTGFTSIRCVTLNNANEYSCSINSVEEECNESEKERKPRPNACC